MSADDLSENYRWAQQFLRGILGRPPFPPDIEVLANKLTQVASAERARPVEREVDYPALIRETIARFPKILEVLAT